MESSDRTTREERQRWVRTSEPASGASASPDPAPQPAPPPLVRPGAHYEEPVAPEPAPFGRGRRIFDMVIGRLIQLVNYLFYLLYGLLGLRFVLGLLGARPGAGFVELVYRLTEPFYRPFAGIVSEPTIGERAIDVPLIIAFVAYVILHAAVRGLLRLFLSGGWRGRAA
ncbi:MAG: YggT family protein [Longimicrobiales bacterium]